MRSLPPLAALAFLLAGCAASPQPTDPAEPRAPPAAAPVTAISIVPSPVAPAVSQPGSGGVVRVDLEAREVVGQLADGVAFEYWTFGGTVPGPMLRVREGDTVEVHLRNHATSRLTHSVDLRAVTGPGGGAARTQTPPGASTSFLFRALNPGVYVYHCATPPIAAHVSNGMYGLIVVEPREGLLPVDREFYVMQGELYTEGAFGEPGLQAASAAKMVRGQPEYIVFNGRVGALAGDGALRANVGETVRMFVGVGGFVPSNFHVIGEVFDAVWPEGGTPAVRNVQTTLVPAGGATLVEFRLEVPGDYLMVDHALPHALHQGAAGVLRVDGTAEAGVLGEGVR